MNYRGEALDFTYDDYVTRTRLNALETKVKSLETSVDTMEKVSFFEYHSKTDNANTDTVNLVSLGGYERVPIPNSRTTLPQEIRMAQQGDGGVFIMDAGYYRIRTMWSINRPVGGNDYKGGFLLTDPVTTTTVLSTRMFQTQSVSSTGDFWNVFSGSAILTVPDGGAVAWFALENTGGVASDILVGDLEMSIMRA